MSDVKSTVPSFNRAQGVPVVSDTIYLGSATKWVDIFDLSAYSDRVFCGISVFNPDNAKVVHIAMGDDFGTTKCISVHVNGFLAFDNQSFGMGYADVSSGRVKKIRAKLDATSGVLASGTITYTAVGTNPTNGMTVSINGIVYEFSSDQSVVPGRYKVDIGVSADATWTNLVNKINAIDQAVTATINTGTDIVTITSNYGGTTGNAITIADGGDGGTPTGETFSGATLAGGSGGVLPTIHIW